MSPSRDKLGELAEAVVPIALQAGQRLLAIHGGDFGVTYKPDGSPLTDADMAAHRIIEEGLAGLAPEMPVLSEESEDQPAAVRRGWSSYWLVDPLDGTREFIKRTNEFTINIALVTDHEPVIGLVFAPGLERLYLAWRGGGAWRTTPEGTEPVRVRGLPKDILVVAGSRSRSDSRLEQFVAGLDRRARLLHMGSALKPCLVAEGAADIYPRFGTTLEWDTAAAQCVVEEAGGYCTDLNGKPLRYNQRDTLRNPHFVVFAAAEAAEYLGVARRAAPAQPASNP